MTYGWPWMSNGTGDQACEVVWRAELGGNDNHLSLLDPPWALWLSIPFITIFEGFDVVLEEFQVLAQKPVHGHALMGISSISFVEGRSKPCQGRAVVFVLYCSWGYPKFSICIQILLGWCLHQFQDSHMGEVLSGQESSIWSVAHLQALQMQQVDLHIHQRNKSHRKAQWLKQ